MSRRPVELERLHHVSRELLRSRDFNAAVTADTELQWWHQRAAHDSFGIADGLWVELTGDGEAVIVSPGLAYDCYGREVQALEEQVVPLPSERTERMTLLVRRQERRRAAAVEPCAGGVRRPEPELIWRRTARADVRAGVPLGVFDPNARRRGRWEAIRSRVLSRPRIGAGVTQPGGTAWTPSFVLPAQSIADGITVRIDTRRAGFTDPPCYFAWLQWPGVGAARDPAWIVLSSGLQTIEKASVDGFTFHVWLGRQRAGGTRGGLRPRSRAGGDCTSPGSASRPRTLSTSTQARRGTHEHVRRHALGRASALLRRSAALRGRPRRHRRVPPSDALAAQPKSPSGRGRQRVRSLRPARRPRGASFSPATRSTPRAVRSSCSRRTTSRCRRSPAIPAAGRHSSTSRSRTRPTTISRSPGDACRCLRRARGGPTARAPGVLLGALVRDAQRSSAPCERRARARDPERSRDRPGPGRGARLSAGRRPRDRGTADRSACAAAADRLRDDACRSGSRLGARPASRLRLRAAAAVDTRSGTSARRRATRRAWRACGRSSCPQLDIEGPSDAFALDISTYVDDATPDGFTCLVPDLQTHRDRECAFPAPVPQRGGSRRRARPGA